MDASQIWNQVTVEAYLPGAADALINRRIPSPVSTRILAGDYAPIQEFCLDGLLPFSHAIYESSTDEVRAMLQILCNDVIRCPKLVSEELELFTSDRLFWDPALRCWRYLLLITQNPEWHRADALTPGRLMADIFRQAIAFSSNAKSYLLQIWKNMGESIILPESLLSALNYTDPNPRSTSVETYPSVQQNSQTNSGTMWNPSTGSSQAVSGWNCEQPQPVMSHVKAGTGGVAIKTIPLIINGLSPVNRKPKDSHPSDPYLVRLKTQESVPVNREKFYIGSNSNRADFVIQDNTAISRVHACIFSCDGQFFIIDNNSLNGVYKGDRRLLPNHQTKLEIGETFRLADETFILRW